jgi:hypothetical protein
MGFSMGLVVASLQRFGFGGSTAAPNVLVVAPKIAVHRHLLRRRPAITGSFRTLRDAVGGRRVGGRFSRQCANRSPHCEAAIDQAALSKPSNISDSSRDFWDKEKNDGSRD